MRGRRGGTGAALRRVAPTLWLMLLAGYCLAGLSVATFHGDESMHISTSRDFFTLFVERQPERLRVTPPYLATDDAQMRLLNGSMARYAFGLALHLAGVSPRAVPPSPGWDWSKSVETNIRNGFLPTGRVLEIARRTSTLFLVGSVVAMFGLGRVLEGELLAYVASGLYVANPAVLLAGRRAMTEGALLCCGLLTLLVAAHMAQRPAPSQRRALGWWVLLALLGGPRSRANTAGPCSS